MLLALAVRAFILPSLLLAARAASAAPEPAATPPDQVSGIAVAEDDSTPARDVGRVVLFPFRIASEIVFAPLRGTAWFVEHYQVTERLQHLFVSDDGARGFYPNVFYDTGLGLSGGLHIFDADVFGHGERVSLGAEWGGAYKQRYDISMATGKLAAGTRIGLRFGFHSIQRADFFGIGNADQSAPMGGGTPLDTAVHTRFGQDVTHVELSTMTDVAPMLAIGLVGAFTHRRFNTDAQISPYQPILAVYDEMSLVGFARGTNTFYSEASLKLDTRAVANRYISLATPSSGWFGRAAVGFAQGTDGDPSHYMRYSADLRRYIDLYGGDRVLVLHGSIEGVTAATDEIPFTDLPHLGGSDLLRGFAHDRFRDRVAAMGSVEYQFPLQSYVSAYGFVDAGRVAHDLGDLDVSGLHVGWGGGVDFHGQRNFLLRLQAAHSSTDGTFIGFALDPTTDLRARNRRE